MAAHHAEIHGFLRRVVGPTGTDDLLERTFLQAFRAHPSLAPDVDRRAWLFALAARLCRPHVRPLLGPPTVRPTGRRGGGPPPGATGPGSGHALTDAIARLPGTLRLALVLRKLHALEYEAIGAGLDCSPARARAHVLRAVRTIQQERRPALTGGGRGSEDRIGRALP